MLANLSLQLRNVLNKRLMQLSPPAEAADDRLLSENGEGDPEELRKGVGEDDEPEEQQRRGGGGGAVPVGPMKPADAILLVRHAML